MNVALDNMTLWHERDISHSSAERVIFPDSTIALDYLLDRMTFIITNLHVYPENMMDNINRTGGLFYSQSLLLKLIEMGLTSEDSYRIVQDAAMRVWKKEGTLRELMEKDPQAASRITRKRWTPFSICRDTIKHRGHLQKGRHRPLVQGKAALLKKILYRDLRMPDEPRRLGTHEPCH